MNSLRKKSVLLLSFEYDCMIFCYDTIGNYYNETTCISLQVILINV